MVFFPSRIRYVQLLKVFWEAHDPTQGMGQGTDIGTQYRSVIFATTADQLEQALVSSSRYGASLTVSGYGEITTEVAMKSSFYYAEEYHQQYLSKNSSGYCGLVGTGVPADW